MASSDVPPLLPHDLERVIQQALVQANDSLRSEAISGQKKSKKRNRDLVPEENEQPAKEPKKKRKKKNKEPVPEVIAGGPDVVATTPNEESQPVEKKKKKKRSKAHDPPPTQEIQIDPALQNLSATPPPPAPIPLPPPPVHVDSDSSNFLPPELRHVFATGGPLNTNEDILRALQDLDITKITGALQSLGEVAAATHISLPNLTTSAPSPPPVRVPPPKSAATKIATSVPNPQTHPSPINQQVTAANDEQPANARPSFTAPPPPAYTSNQNPEHAQLLYTKWLNNAKLADLAKTIGPFLTSYVL